MTMKTIIVAFTSMFFALITNAESTHAPNYTCSGNNGLTYELYSTEFNEIHVLDQQNSMLGMIDSIDFETRYLKSNPMQVVVTVTDEDQQWVATLRWVDGEKTATGLIDDYVTSESSPVSLTCSL